MNQNQEGKTDSKRSKIILSLSLDTKVTSKLTPILDLGHHIPK
jgi:hypothetical protein